NETLDIAIGKEFDEVADMGSILVSGENEQHVPLSDIAELEQTQAEAQSVSRTNGDDAITLMILPSNDANFIELSEEAMAIMDEAEIQMADSTQFILVLDQAEFIADAIAGLATEGMWGLVLAVL